MKTTWKLPQKQLSVPGVFFLENPSVLSFSLKISPTPGIIVIKLNEYSRQSTVTTIHQ